MHFPFAFIIMNTRYRCETEQKTLNIVLHKECGIIRDRIWTTGCGPFMCTEEGRMVPGDALTPGSMFALGSVLAPGDVLTPGSALAPEKVWCGMVCAAATVTVAKVGMKLRFG